MRIRFVIPAALLVAAAYAKARRDAVAPRPVSARGCDLSEEARVRAEAEAADAFELAGESPVTVAEPAPVAPPAPAVRPTAEHAVAEMAATLAPAPPEHPAAGWEAPEFPFAAARPARPARPAAAEAGPDLAAVAEWSTAPAGPAPAPVVQERVEEDDPDSATLSEWATSVIAATTPVPDVVPAPVVEVRIDEEGRFSLGGWAAQAGHMALCGVTFRDRHDRPVAVSDIRLVPDGLANVAEGGVVVLGDPGFAPDAEGFTLLVAAAGPGAFAATGRYEVLAA